MNKRLLLPLVVVLSLSTGAWASVFADVTVCPPCPDCWDNVLVNVKACVPKEGYVKCTEWCIKGNFIMVDVYLQCPPSACGGSTKVNQTVCVGDLCPGTYAVIATVRCYEGCKPYAMTYAVGSTFFKVSCPTPCWPCWP